MRYVHGTETAKKDPFGGLCLQLTWGLFCDGLYRKQTEYFVETAPTLGRVMKQFKAAVTKQLGISIWQKGYYEHIIRDDQDFLRIWQYIDSNPAKWLEDKYYVNETMEVE